MTTFIAITAALGAFLGSALGLSIVMGFIAEANRFFALLFRVQPYRSVFSILLFFAAGWVAFSVFDAIA